jgi:cytochrome P450
VLAYQRFSSKGAARLSRPDQQADHSSTHTEPGTQHDPERPPVQTKLRNLVNRAFTPRPVDPLRPRIQELTNGLLDKVQASAEMEVSSDLAYPLPVAVITVLLGAEVEMAKQLRRWTDDLGSLLGSPEPTPEMFDRANRSVIKRDEYILSLAAQRRLQPKDDLISALVSVEENGERLSDADLCAICGLLLSAGHETTSNLICNGLLALLRHPQ